MKKVLVCLLTLTLMSLSVVGATGYNLSGTTLTITGTGAMPDYSAGGAPWYSSIGTITTININDGITHIGSNAFYNAQKATRVNIPATVSSIGENAFAVNSTMAGIYFAGSPNEWATITFANDAANPFTDANSASTRNFYFYGSEKATTILTLTPGITTVNAYAFKNANKITDINIPGSVSYIGKYAFACNVSGSVCINRTIPPTTGGKYTITYGSSAKLYVPSSAVSTYSAQGEPWKAASYGSSYGASSVNGQAVSGNLAEASSITWSLDEDGVLTLNATGATKAITFNVAGASHPWGYFRRLVYKVKLQGEITALGKFLRYHYGFSEVVLDQNTIPTCTGKIAATGDSGESYASLFNPRDLLTLRIKLSSLLSPTQAAKLETAPWNDGHWQIAIDDEVVVDENSADNLELFDAIQKYVDVPFTMRLERSVSNAYYNTFCSPIDLDAETVEATFGAGTLIHELASTSYDEEANELTLEFADSQNYMEAGVPYLFKPANSVSNPTFTDVDPTAVATAEGEVNAPDVTFFGTLEPVEVTSLQIDAKNFIFLLANNQLTWANGGTLKAMRAYWLLKDGVPSRALSRRPIMRIGQSAQGIEEVSGDWRQETRDGKQVTGRKVLRDGQLIIVHEGVEYNAQGIRL